MRRAGQGTFLVAGAQVLIEREPFHDSYMLVDARVTRSVGDGADHQRMWWRQGGAA